MDHSKIIDTFDTYRHHMSIILACAFDLSRAKRLGQQINNVFICVYLAKLNMTRPDELSNQVVPPEYVLVLLMSSWFLGLCNCPMIRPFCITILYHNLLLFIDIFHIRMQYLRYFILFCMFDDRW